MESTLWNAFHCCPDCLPRTGFFRYFDSMDSVQIQAPIALRVQLTKWIFNYLIIWMLHLKKAVVKKKWVLKRKDQDIEELKGMPLTKTSSHDRPSQSAIPKYLSFYTILYFIGYGVDKVFLWEKYCILHLRGTGTVALRKCGKDVCKNQNALITILDPKKVAKFIRRINIALRLLKFFS